MSDIFYAGDPFPMSWNLRVSDHFKYIYVQIFIHKLICEHNFPPENNRMHETEIDGPDSH